MSLASASSRMVVHWCVHASFLKEEMNFKITTFFYLQILLKKIHIWSTLNIDGNNTYSTMEELAMDNEAKHYIQVMSNLISQSFSIEYCSQCEIISENNLKVKKCSRRLKHT